MNEQAAPTPPQDVAGSQSDLPVPPAATQDRPAVVPSTESTESSESTDSAESAEPAESAAVPPVSAGGLTKRGVAMVAAFVVLSIGGLLWAYLGGGAAERAKVGDCVAGDNKDDIRAVACDDAAALHRVVGKLVDKTEAELIASDNLCAAYPTARTAFWEGEQGGKGYVLCLEPVRG